MFAAISDMAIVWDVKLPLIVVERVRLPLPSFLNVYVPGAAVELTETASTTPELPEIGIPL